MGKKQPKNKVNKPREEVNVTRVRFEDWPEELKRLQEEARRSERITSEDLQVIINV